MQVFTMSAFWTVIADIGGWLAVHLGVSYLCIRLPDRWFIPSPGSSSPRFAGRERRFYEKTLRIKQWKDRMPDGGALMGGGFAKKRLAAADRMYLNRYVLETRRGELAHWLPMLSTPLFFLWNNLQYGWILVLYALLANVPFICILRYNRLRLLHILK